MKMAKDDEEDILFDKLDVEPSLWGASSIIYESTGGEGETDEEAKGWRDELKVLHNEKTTEGETSLPVRPVWAVRNYCHERHIAYSGY